MQKTLEDQLFKDYPLLYDRNDISRSMIGFGFDCHDGWYDLIDELSKRLYPLIQEIRKTPVEYGMYPIAVQVKEKFGELRFYMDNSSDEMEDLINEYSESSHYICEICGKNGKIDYTQKWLKCRCKKHR